MTLTEEMRPQTLDDIIGQPDAIAVLKGLIRQAKAGVPLPHLLFSGPYGVGKTSAAYAFAREMLGHGWKENFREVETVDNRGVDKIREEVGPWLSRMAAYDAPVKLMLIDEFDYLTEIAQAALRRVMETESDVTRFILAANDPSKIIGAIHSRCLHLRFRPLSDEDMLAVLVRTAERKNLHPTPEFLRSIVRHANGQARDAINALEGGDVGERWARFDSAVEHLFGNGVARDSRIETFLQFLYAEGYREWGAVLKSIDGHVREKRLRTGEEYVRFIREATTTAYRAKVVDDGLFEIRGFLFEVVP